MCSELFLLPLFQGATEKVDVGKNRFCVCEIHRISKELSFTSALLHAFCFISSLSEISSICQFGALWELFQWQPAKFFSPCI